MRHESHGSKAGEGCNVAATHDLPGPCYSSRTD